MLNRMAKGIKILLSLITLMAGEEHTIISGVDCYATTISGVTSYVTKTILETNEEIGYIKDQTQKEKKQDELDEYWRALARHDTLILITDAFLKYSPTFTFGVVAYSLIIDNSPNIYNLAAALGIFVAFCMIMAALRSTAGKEIFSLRNKVQTLKKEVSKLGETKD